MRHVLLALLLLAGCMPLASPEPAQLQAIANHPWWKAKPAPAQVGALADAITKLNADQGLLIDGGGSVVPNQLDGLHPLVARELVEAGMAAPRGTIFVFLDGRRHGKRLTRDEALTLLQGELDRADFQGR